MNRRNTPSSPPANGWMQQAQRAQHPSCAEADGDVIEWIAAGLAAVSPPWQLAADQSPTDHHAERVLATDAYDAWLVHWPPFSEGWRVPSLAAPGVVAVVDGSLRVGVHTTTGVRLRQLAAGETVRIDTEHEWLANPHPRSVTTLHVYSPPIGALAAAQHSQENAA